MMPSFSTPDWPWFHMSAIQMERMRMPLFALRWYTSSHSGS